MHVAVASMKDVGDPQPVFLAHSGNEPERLWNLRPGHDAILRVIGRSQASEGSEGILSSLPEQRSFCFAAGTPHFPRPVGQADAGNCFGLLLDGFSQSF